MRYTIIRNITKEGKWNKYNYRVSELPKMSASTNYHRNIEKAIWDVEYNNIWYVEQNNSSLRWTEWIPIVNFFIALFYHRKYTVFRDGICVGNADKIKEKGEMVAKRRFTIHEKEYFIGRGNTTVGWPNKKYEWPIERQDGKVLAIVKKPSGEAVYKLEILEEMPIEILILMVMMTDIHRFSSENTSPTNANC